MSRLSEDGPELYKRRVFTGILDAFERIAYLAIALALSVPIVMLVVSAAMSMLEASEAGVLQTVLAVLDRLLLAFIIRRIDRHDQGHGERARDLYRRTVLTGGTYRRCAAHPTAYRRTRADRKHRRVPEYAHRAGVMTGLVIVLTSALYFTRRMRLSEKELESLNSFTQLYAPLMSSHPLSFRGDLLSAVHE